MASYDELLAYGVTFDDDIDADSEASFRRLGLTINLSNFAASQYGGLDFNSLCVFNGKLLAGNSGGIYECGGDSDVGRPINALFKTASTDFGYDGDKELRLATVSGLLEGKLTIVAYPDDVDGIEASIKWFPSEQTSVTVGMSTEDRGRYWGLEIANIDGTDFSIDGIDCLFVPLTNVHRNASGVIGRLSQNTPICEVAASGA